METKLVLDPGTGQEDREDFDLLEFVLDTTIQKWGDDLESQQLYVADDHTLTTEQAMSVAANMYDNLERLKKIRKRLSA